MADSRWITMSWVLGEVAVIPHHDGRIRVGRLTHAAGRINRPVLPCRRGHEPRPGGGRVEPPLVLAHDPRGARVVDDEDVVRSWLRSALEIELCRRIRACLRDVAMVLLTSSDDAVATRTVRLADADGYLLRDLRDGDLGRVLRSAISSRTGRAASPRLLT